MTDEKCCCNCLHCARWQTSEGVKCHCDLTDRYLSYLDVMDTDNNCCSWEKETKWDIQKEHDMEIYNKAIDDYNKELKEYLRKFTVHYVSDKDFDYIAEQLKAGGKNDN